MEISFEERSFGGSLRIRLDNDLDVRVNLDQAELESLRKAIGADNGDIEQKISELRDAVTEARNGMCSAKSEIDSALGEASRQVEEAESQFDRLMDDIESAMSEIDGN